MTVGGGDSMWTVLALWGAVLTAATSSQVLVISLDGFRWDYPDLYSLPTFRDLAGRGVRASQGMTPAFVTLTVPNHVTLSTGLYQEHHGVVSYQFYDPILNRVMNKADMKDPLFWGQGEPIWMTAIRAGLRSAVHSWAGSDVDGRRPTYLHPYNSSVSLESRVAWAIDRMKNDGASLALIYHPLPDKVEHANPLNSEAVRRAILNTDADLGRALSLVGSNVTVVVVSDHGFSEFHHDRSHVAFLDDYLDPEKDYRMVTQVGAVAGVWPRPGRQEEVVRKLTAILPASFKVYRRQDVPAHFHYSNNSRVPPILVLANEGYYVDQNLKTFNQYFSLDNKTTGDHGYLHTQPNMRPIFFARGPGLKSNFQSPKLFPNVSVYPLICHLLGIDPAPNDGSLEDVRHFLSERRRG